MSFRKLLVLVSRKRINRTRSAFTPGNEERISKEAFEFPDFLGLFYSLVDIRGTTSDYMISCDVSVFGNLRLCRPHKNDRPPFSNVSTLESVFLNLCFYQQTSPFSIVCEDDQQKVCVFKNRNAWCGRSLSPEGKRVR